MKLRFLQISDIHFQYKNYNTAKLRDKLVEKLEMLHKEMEFNSVLVTGDIAHQGGDCAEDTKTFLEDILSATNTTKSNTHIIPGNHDIQRDEIRSLILDGIFSKENPSNHLDSVEKTTYDSLLSGQTNFFNFYEDFKGENYPDEYIHIVHEAETYNIIHLNTCITTYKDKQEGHLLIGKSKLYDVLNQHKTSLIDSSKINIAIGHHTLECIEPSERQVIMNNFDDFNIDIYVAGHVHKPKYFFTANSSDFPFVELTSGALFMDEYASPGFVVLDIDTESNVAESSYYIWNSEHDYWTINNQLGRRVIDGKLQFDLERF